MSKEKESVGIPIPITGDFTKVASVLTGVLKYFQAADCGPEDVFSVVDGILSYAASQARGTVSDMARIVSKRAEAIDEVMTDPSSVEKIDVLATVDLRPGGDSSSWSNATREDLN
jgi:hypothetical protein